MHPSVCDVDPGYIVGDSIVAKKLERWSSFMSGAGPSGELEVSKFPGGTDCEVVGHSQGMFRYSPSISVCIGFLASYEFDIGPGGPSSGATGVSQVERSKLLVYRGN